MTKKVKALFILILSVALLLSMSPFSQAASTQTQASDKAYNWVVNRFCSTGLLNSFNDSQDITYTYDQAVAALAFLVKGDITNTKKALDTLKNLQTADGSWYTAYYCSSGGVQEGRQHVGPNMWIVMAVAHYENMTGDTTRYNNMITKAINWVLQFQQSDGGINGGLDYNGNPEVWASTEHNEDAYVVLKRYGYTIEASAVKSFLDNKVWDNTYGYFWGGRNDSRDPMDTNAWGVQALGSSGTHNYNRGLDYVMNHHRNKQNYRKASKTITVDGFDFNSDKNDIWLEGQGQMVVSFKIDGRTTDAEYFLNEIIKVQDLFANGGVPYSLKGTDNGYWKMKNVESISATGWLIYAIHGVNPFQL